MVFYSHHEVEMVPVKVSDESLRVVQTVFVYSVGNCWTEQEIQLHATLVYVHYKGMVERTGLGDSERYLSLHMEGTYYMGEVRNRQKNPNFSLCFRIIP